jgi:hypothetical protein
MRTIEVKVRRFCVVSGMLGELWIVCRKMINRQLTQPQVPAGHVDEKSASRQLGFAGTDPDPICTEAGFSDR